MALHGFALKKITNQQGIEVQSKLNHFVLHESAFGYQAIIRRKQFR